MTPVSPGVPEDTAFLLSQLAPLAKNYRSGMAPSHPASRANEEMDQIVQDLRANDVSIADIARAASVTHRAIARRLTKND